MIRAVLCIIRKIPTFKKKSFAKATAYLGKVLGIALGFPRVYPRAHYNAHRVSISKICCLRAGRRKSPLFVYFFSEPVAKVFREPKHFIFSSLEAESRALGDAEVSTNVRCERADLGGVIFLRMMGRRVDVEEMVDLTRGVFLEHTFYGRGAW